MSATGNAPGRCNIEFWNDTSTPAGSTSVNVQCANPAGVATDLPFSIVALQ